MNYPCLQFSLTIYNALWAVVFFIFWQSSLNPDGSACFATKEDGQWQAWPGNPGLSVKTVNVGGLMTLWFLIGFIIKAVTAAISLIRCIYGFYRKSTKLNAALAII